MAQSQRLTFQLVTLGLLLLAMSAATLYALNMCLYFAWLTATPADPRQAAWGHRSVVWFWIACGLAVLTLILVWRVIAVGRRLWRLRHPPGTCLGCGYDRSNSPDICPECGSASAPRL
jgi:hypothetical protein